MGQPIQTLDLSRIETRQGLQTYLGDLQHFLQVGNSIIRDTDRIGLALLLKLLHNLPRLAQSRFLDKLRNAATLVPPAHEVCMNQGCLTYLGTVNQVQVDLIDTELSRRQALFASLADYRIGQLTNFRDFSRDFRGSALPPAAHSISIGSAGGIYIVFVRLTLGRQEDVIPLDTQFLYRLSDALLVGVHFGTVNVVHVRLAVGHLDGILGFLLVQSGSRSVSKHGNLKTIVEFDITEVGHFQRS